MRTITDGNLTVVAFDAAVYKQERNTLACTVGVAALQDYKKYAIYLLQGGTTLAIFSVNSAGKVTIDMTDYIRLHASGTVNVYAEYNQAIIAGTVSVNWSVAGLISPARLFVPDTPAAATIRQDAQTPYNWLLPTRVLQPTTSGDVIEVYGLQGAYMLKSTGALHPYTYYLYIEGGISDYPSVQPSDIIIAIYQFVFGMTRTYEQIAPHLVDPHDATFQYTFTDILFTTQEDADSRKSDVSTYINTSAMPLDFYDIFTMTNGNPDTTEKAVTGAAFDSLTIGSTIKTIGVTDSEKNIVQSVAIVPRRCGVLYAAVEWVSATGHTRRAAWEVREHKQQTGDTVAIATVTNDFDIRKGREDGLTLRLDSLTAFDVWYYGDIVSSSSVRVSLDGGQTWQAVKVESKDVAIPDGDGGELQELKIQVTYAEYDAVVM